MITAFAFACCHVPTVTTNSTNPHACAYVHGTCIHPVDLLPSVFHFLPKVQSFIQANHPTVQPHFLTTCNAPCLPGTQQVPSRNFLQYHLICDDLCAIVCACTTTAARFLPCATNRHSCSRFCWASVYS